MATKKQTTPEITIVEDRTVEIVTRDDDGNVTDRTSYQQGEEEALREELADRPEDFQHFLNTGAIELSSDATSDATSEDSGEDDSKADSSKSGSDAKGKSSGGAKKEGGSK